MLCIVLASITIQLVITVSSEFDFIQRAREITSPSDDIICCCEVPVSEFGTGTRIFAYLYVPAKIVVVRVPKPGF